MSLNPGTRFGSYEVAEAIGSGGMGEVWRATDTELKRDVAIKVLPDSFATDPDRLTRFQREAEILASLNHSNIAQIHGLEKADDQTVIVMELIEGPTLADRIKEGPVPPDEAMNIAMQIVSALEAAHANQIVHRDLKPANVKLKDDGTVKVLDFGISKSIDPKTISGSPVMTTPAVTETGVILGTAAYMSPEQARGKFVDQRTDIWAFGCLLFEMLTGQPAFGAEDVMLTLARVLDRDTDLSSIPKTISPAVRHTLKLCLEKEPRKRIADIRDVRLALEGAFETELPRRDESTGRAPVWRQVMMIAAALLIGGLAVWGLMPPDSLSVSRWEYTLPDQVSFRNANRPTIAISPDGSRFVYNVFGGLYLRSMDELEAQIIPGTEPQLMSPTFSPDGQSLAFWSALDAQLKKIAVVGGTPVTLAEVAANPFGISWGVDGTIFYSVPQGVMRVSEDGGQPDLIISPEQQAAGPYPQLLPGGDAILVNTGGVLLGGEISVYSIASGESKRLFPGSLGRYVSTGHIVYVENGVLFGVPFDVDQLEVTGGPVPLVEGIELSPPKYSVSDTGTLIYVSGGAAAPTVDGVLTWVDRAGELEQIPVPPRPYRHPRLSPDGMRLAVQTTDSSGASDIWVYNLDGATQMRLMTGEGNNSRPIWTPDGEALVFTSDRDGVERIYRQRADLTGVAQPLTPGEPGVQQWPDSFAPDGTLSFTKFGGGQGVWTVSMEEGTEPELFVADGGGSAFSPDGQWITYRANRPDEQLYVKPFPATPTELQLTQDGGSYPMWSRDGTELFYRRGAQSLNLAQGGGRQSPSYMALSINLEGPEWGNERLLPVDGFQIFFGSRDQDVSLDGERFLMVFPESEAEDVREPPQPNIVVVENWFEELKERVPTD